MRLRSNCIACCGYCTPATRCTSFLAPKDDWSSGRPASRAMIIRLFPLRGALDLLTSAYSVLPALAEARILEFNTQVRPALPDNTPAIHFDPQRKCCASTDFIGMGFYCR